MASPKDSNDSYVKRNAMSNVTAGGKKVFRTAVFGYNKVAVNDYIDKLYSEYSEGEKALTSEIAKLREVNAELEKRSTDVDSRFEEVRAQVTSELAFVSEFHDQEDEYNRRIEELNELYIVKDPGAVMSRPVMSSTHRSCRDWNPPSTALTIFSARSMRRTLSSPY